MKKFFISLIALLLPLCPAGAQRDSIRISLLSCEPGAAIYELYGHTAIRVQDFMQGRDIVFNYGVFDFNTPHFIWRFCLGRTDYLLGVQRMGDFADEYERRGSRVWSQELNLTPQENRRLYDLLLENCQPQNRVYRYNFLYGNCATMALDKIEQGIDGHVMYPAPADSMSFRNILTAHTSIKPWSRFAVNLVVGALADRQLEYRQEAFAPLLLKDLVAQAIVTDPQDSVHSLAFPPQVIVEPDHGVDFGRCLITPVQAMWLLLLVTVFISLWGWYRKRMFVLFDILLFGIQGIAGLIIAFLFFLSEHPAVDTNWIIAILNPLPLVFLPFAVSRIRKGRMDWFMPAEFILCAAFAAFSGVIPQTIEPAVVLLAVSFAVRAFSSSLFMLSNLKHRPAKCRMGKMAKCLVSILLPACAACAPAQAQSAKPKTPRLVIGIVLDQFDMACLEQLRPILRTDGLAMLLDSGYVMENAVLDFDGADRASGTAAIFTGSSPLDNGVIASEWMSRKSMMSNPLVDDSNYMGQGTSEFSSPAKLQASTIGDCLKLSTNGKSKVCSIGIERDAAILAGGHEADVVLWMNPVDCRWCTSDYYGEMPVWAQRSVSDKKHTNWEPSVPVSILGNRYILDVPDAFSHNIRTDRPQDFRTSPMANTSVTDMALNAIGAMGLGIDHNTDLLVVSMFAGNFQNIATDWWSHEQQDIYLRLDEEIARLISGAGLKAGESNILYFLTSTGYANRYRSDLKGTRIPSGTVSMERLTALLNLYLSAKYDCPNLAKSYFRNHIYLDRKSIEDKGLELNKVLESCIDLLSQASGVRNIVLLRDLLSVLPDSETARMRNAQSQDYSGDLIIGSLPGWTIEDEIHGISISGKNVPWSFPIAFYGSCIRQGHDGMQTSASILAPTISFVTGAQIPNACSASPRYDIFKQEQKNKTY